jgi:hypothetical protein
VLHFTLHTQLVLLDLFFFFAVLGFELRVLHILCRYSITLAISPALFVLVMSKTGSCVYARGQPLTVILLSMPPT